MDQLTEIKVLIAIADNGSFAGAARQLGLSPPVVTRAVASLEKRLGVQLVNRTTRVVKLTATGEAYASETRQISAQLAAADEAARGIAAFPRGLLNVTAPSMFGRLHVAPIIQTYLEQYPETEVNALFVDRVVDLVEEGFDIGVRIGQLPDSSMRARPVGSVRQVLIASPDYLSRHHPLDRPGDLSHHTTIATSASGSQLEWRFADDQRVRISPRLRVNANDAAISLAISGLGIARVLSYQVSKELESGELQLLLEDWEIPPRPVQLVYRESPQLRSSRVSAFLVLASETLGTALSVGGLRG